MQINFEAEQIKVAHAYVDRLTPVKIEKQATLKTTEKDEIVIDKNFYTSMTEDKPSFVKSILNFLFK